MSRRGQLFHPRARQPYVRVSGGTPTTGPLRKIRLLPRGGFAARWAGAAIEGSNDGTSWTLIASIGNPIDNGMYYEENFTNSVAYFRYRCRSIVSDYFDAAELEFWTISAEMTPVSTFGTPGFGGLPEYALANAFDNDDNTYWASDQATVGTAHIGIVVS